MPEIGVDIRNKADVLEKTLLVFANEANGATDVTFVPEDRNITDTWVVVNPDKELLYGKPFVAINYQWFNAAYPEAAEAIAVVVSVARMNAISIQTLMTPRTPSNWAAVYVRWMSRLKP